MVEKENVKSFGRQLKKSKKAKKKKFKKKVQLKKGRQLKIFGIKNAKGFSPENA